MQASTSNLARYSKSVFTNAASAEFVASAVSQRQFPDFQGLPEVIVTVQYFLGRANVGKSSLLNAVLGRRDLVRTSKKAGRTKALNFFRVGPSPGGLILVDAPGYGARGRVEWGTLFDDYINTRKELKRVYLLLNADHGLKETDAGMLSHLHEKCLANSPWTFQAVITKVDQVPMDGLAKAIEQLRKDIFEVAPTCLPPLVTSSSMRPPFGSQEMRKSILEACSLPH